MSRHKLKPGQDVIDALVALGQALKYDPATEWPLPGGTASVDVAWLRRPGDSAPLLMFEVESRPGEGLVSNAMKILGRSSAANPKPLHLFHIVVRGGVASQRPDDT